MDYCCWACYRKGLLILPFISEHYQFKVGESIQGVEFKFNSWCPKSHRLSIEIEERTAIDRLWVKSGIYRSDNTWLYIQGTLKKAWAFSIRYLRRLNDSKKFEYKEEQTIKTFYLPEKIADGIAVFLLYPEKDTALVINEMGWHSSGIQ